MSILAIALALAGLLAGGEKTPQPVPLPNAHAHNDYYHKRPLLDALDRGFCSVEADVLLVDGRLCVGHSAKEVRPDRTLDALYLAPLRERVRSNGGRVYPDGPVFTLLVDIKTDGEKTYAVLRRQLAEYADMLTTTGPKGTKQGAVQVVISGACPRKAIQEEEIRHCAIDGRPGDLDSDAPADLIPMISSDWRSHFKWLGYRRMRKSERTRLRQFAAKAHAKGRRVRFWGVPHSEAVWREMRKAGVDLINADDLDRLRAFLLKEAASGGSVRNRPAAQQ